MGLQFRRQFVGDRIAGFDRDGEPAIVILGQARGFPPIQRGVRSRPFRQAQLEVRVSRCAGVRAFAQRLHRECDRRPFRHIGGLRDPETMALVRERG